MALLLRLEGHVPALGACSGGREQLVLFMSQCFWFLNEVAAENQIFCLV